MLKHLFSFVASLLLAVNLMAQNDGPSLQNIHKTMDATREELSRQEILNFFYMGIGFAIVLAVAWFSTSLAKKRKLERDEALRRHHQNFKHTTHDPYFLRHQGHSKVRK